MWLILDRPRFQRALEGVLAQSATNNLEPLGQEWFDGMARIPEEAGWLRRRVNNARSDAKAIARIKSGRLFPGGA